MIASDGIINKSMGANIQHSQLLRGVWRENGVHHIPINRLLDKLSVPCTAGSKGRVSCVENDEDMFISCSKNMGTNRLPAHRVLRFCHRR
jgi:hypothetical protein